MCNRAFLHTDAAGEGDLSVLEKVRDVEYLQDRIQQMSKLGVTSDEDAAFLEVFKQADKPILKTSTSTGADECVERLQKTNC